MSQIVLITGSTRGIGLAAARQLIARGATVIIGSREIDRATATAASLGPQAHPLQIDITSDLSLEAAVKHLREKFGHLDVLANNSAILLDHYQSLFDLTSEVFSETLATNLIGTFRATKAILPLLKAAKAPRVINVASGAGQLDGEPQAWAPAYSISKTALNSLTVQMTAALSDVIINSMCPGWCRTEMGGEAAPRSADEGADTLTWLALDAPETLRGQFVKDRKVIPW